MGVAGEFDAVPELRLATPADRSAVIDTVVAAFDRDPAFRWFFPTPSSWDRHVARFVGALFDSRVYQGSTWMSPEAEAVAMWVAPDADGHRPTLTGFDDESTSRLAAYGAATRDGLPTSPHWYLGVLATHPAHRGRSLGRTVMQEGLRAVGRSGLPAFLETTNPANVDLYERAGWRRSSQHAVDSLTIWVFRHDGITSQD